MKEIKNTPILFLLTLYAFLVSIIYLRSYWGKFNIDIFHYMSINEIAISSIYPLIWTFIVYFLSFLFGSFDEIGTVEDQTKFRYSMFVLAFSIAISFSAFFFVFVFYFTFLIAIVLKNRFRLEKILTFSEVPMVVVYLIVLLPMFSWHFGSENGKKIINNEIVQYVDSDLLNIKNDKFIEDKVKYIGYSGNTYFFISNDNENIFILNKSSIPYLMVSKPSTNNIKQDLNIVKLWKFVHKLLTKKESVHVPIESDVTKQKSDQDGKETTP